MGRCGAFLRASFRGFFWGQFGECLEIRFFLGGAGCFFGASLGGGFATFEEVLLEGILGALGGAFDGIDETDCGL